MSISTELLLQKLLDLNGYPPDNSKIASGSNAAAVVTLAADTTDRKNWHIDTVTVSYSAAPTAGVLTVFAGATPVFQVDITAAGPTTLAVFKDGENAGAMSVSLSAGGSGITGRVNVNARLM